MASFFLAAPPGLRLRRGPHEMGFLPKRLWPTCFCLLTPLRLRSTFNQD